MRKDHYHKGGWVDVQHRRLGDILLRDDGDDE
jgi:hypothetical protein